MRRTTILFISKWNYPINSMVGTRTWRLVISGSSHLRWGWCERLGKTLHQWRQAFLAYFDTGRSNNGGTEAINDLIELHRRIARGFRNYDNYRLRMLLIGGGLTHPHLK